MSSQSVCSWIVKPAQGSPPAAIASKWYEASKIEEIGANEAKGSRIDKITSALGTLCVTTRAGKNGETMIGMCPK
ncbi:hypothetical protein [Janthinobacterium sp. LB2P70]|uniref:hypothetical protein n=1 Tax=Janthinobacterium sp. LB2P70 TaxID=3424197 RepID=UPI003F224EBD